jgi:8-oxo-dGTP pyrophosphatase MutT (NUDIX family)
VTLRAVRAERLARRIEKVLAAEDTHCSAKAVITNPFGEVLVLRDAGGKWHDLPGGRIHDGEDAITGLAREVREETGLSIGDIKLGETISFKAGKVPRTTLLFKATALTIDVNLSNEHSGYEWVKPDKLPDYELGILLAPACRILKPVAVLAQDASRPFTHHEAAQLAAEGIYKAAVDNWIADLSSKLMAILFGRKPEDYDAIWLDVYGAAAGGWVAAMAQAISQAHLAAFGILAPKATPPPKQELEGLAKARESALRGFPAAVRDKVAESLKRGAEGGEDARALARRLQEDFQAISKGAAARVAATEAQVTYGVSQAKALELAGYRRKKWVTVGDDRVRDSHLLCEDQGAVPVSASFQNGLKFPGDPNGSAEEVINCRCWLEGER